MTERLPTQGLSTLPREISIDGVPYRRADLPRTDRLGAHLMYDCHAFRRCKGRTVTELVADWQTEHDHPDEYGRPCLCPIIVLDGKTELRRVGNMVHPLWGGDSAARIQAHQADLKAFIAACEADPDIPRLLAEGRNCSE